MRIVIETVPHASMPYPTCGDWRRDGAGTLWIRVSSEIGDKFASLVALHELVEVLLCEARGITTESVDAFDIEFEKQRAKSLVVDTSEPGDDPEAPYQNEHCIATGVERIVAAALGVRWDEYERAINALP